MSKIIEGMHFFSSTNPKFPPTKNRISLTHPRLSSIINPQKGDVYVDTINQTILQRQLIAPKSW